MQRVLIGLLPLFVSIFSCASVEAGGDQPNILWITSEDNGPHLGAYGDGYADTPVLDGLADRGSIYTNAWSNAPVCAPARTTIITGIYPTSTGSQHMRSMTQLPAGFQMFPERLREVGYYCTNRSKEDYNLKHPGQVWDDSSRSAHWRGRAPGQPFFAVFNLTISHESQTRKRPHEPVHDPAAVRVPAYHPDHKDVRRDWAQYYDKVSEMDAGVGRVLAQLDEDGLRDETIVVYFGDHGPGLPRSKRSPYNSGLQVPLIVSFPQKYLHLAPSEYEAGGRCDRLVSFVDLAPSMLSLVGIEPAPELQGRAIFGEFEGSEPAYLFGFRDRMDERYDLIRTVRDHRYQYLRNYLPHRIAGAHVAYMFQTPTTRVWQKLYLNGSLNRSQSAFWETKPSEELYDLDADPDQVNNLAASEPHLPVLLRMRAALREEILRRCDLGFLSEDELVSRCDGDTPYEMGRDELRYPLDRILAAAELASTPGTDPMALIAGLEDPDSAVRRWSAIGLTISGEAAVRQGRDGLLKALVDVAPAVRIAAAEALGRYGSGGDRSQAADVLIGLADLRQHDVRVVIQALNSLDAITETVELDLGRLQTLPRQSTDTPPRLRGSVPRLLDHILAAGRGREAFSLGQGLMAGEVTANSAFVQTRLTRGTALIDGDAFDDGDVRRDGDLAGSEATVRFELSTDPSFAVAGLTQASVALRALSERDFIIRHRFDALDPDTKYYYRVSQAGGNRASNGDDSKIVGSFTTLPGSARQTPMRCHVVTGLNYDKFFDHTTGYLADDRDQGYPALQAMAALRPDFMVFTGDSVYYDKPPNVQTLADMRAKWHRQLAQPRMIELLRIVPAYWEKDDHDHRFNDCDTTGNRFPRSDIGAAVFREQVPIFLQGDHESPAYRTHRITRDLQIWLLEGRDHRSPNRIADDPDKTLWGERQRSWLKRTLIESDATYKLVISPTPLLGPDDASKRDNHTNVGGFRTEGRAFLRWAQERGLWQDGTFLICGDRHWQYHSVHPTGAQEFSCGAICDANSRLGRRPGDRNSTDPESRLTQPYNQTEASGGFLSVVIEPSMRDAEADDETTGAAQPTILFEFYDEHGELLYSHDGSK